MKWEEVLGKHRSSWIYGSATAIILCKVYFNMKILRSGAQKQKQNRERNPNDSTRKKPFSAKAFRAWQKNSLKTNPILFVLQSIFIILMYFTGKVGVRQMYKQKSAIANSSYIFQRDI
ncbi:hypothetical protein GQX74_011349 [Glossina fuscipes]|nr:hypothetical protein GQX74_011349 [Glossina fuscipes]